MNKKKLWQMPETGGYKRFLRGHRLKETDEGAKDKVGVAMERCKTRGNLRKLCFKDID